MEEKHHTPSDKNTVIVTICGKPYSGRITLNGIALTEKEMGKPFTSFAVHAEQFGIAELLAVLRYSLHPVDAPDRYLTETEWEEISSSSEFGEVIEAANLLVPLLTKQLRG